MRYAIDYNEFMDYLDEFNNEFPSSYICPDSFEEDENFEVEEKDDGSYDVLVGSELIFNTQCGAVDMMLYDDYEMEDWFGND